MKTRLTEVEGRGSRVEGRARRGASRCPPLGIDNPQSKIPNPKSKIQNPKSKIPWVPQRGFSLIELLVVLAIIGMLAYLGLPALQGLAKPNAISAANRQLLDDFALARITAISGRTTVYVAFAPPNLYDQMPRLVSPSSNPVDTAERDKQIGVLTNLMNGQFRAYALMAARSVGDQPGQYRSRYLTDWRLLPEGVLIATNKYGTLMTVSMDSGEKLGILPFATNSLPFPTVDSPLFTLPCLAFNPQGQLESLGRPLRADEYLPLARGSVMPLRDVKGLMAPVPADVREVPPGNSTNTYDLIQISWLTGRARVVKREVR
jgi:prepilin-type N-terminal cleavage/methylation domain-containing protein